MLILLDSSASSRILRFFIQTSRSANLEAGPSIVITASLMGQFPGGADRSDSTPSFEAPARWPVVT